MVDHTHFMPLKGQAPETLLRIVGLVSIMLGFGLVLAAGHVDYAWPQPVGIALAIVGLLCRMGAAALQWRRAKTTVPEGR